MIPKQQERIITKIKKIKAELAADKKRWGGFYNDSRGLRYLPPRLYIQLTDFSGGLRYMNWFTRNFSDDCGFPDFLFEWTIILFKTGRLKDAEKKAFETFCCNTYIFNKFFDRVITPIDKYENSNIDIPQYATDYFDYSYKQSNLTDFSEWLKQFLETDIFLLLSNKYIDIYKRLKVEHDREIRHYLIVQAGQLENELK